MLFELEIIVRHLFFNTIFGFLFLIGVILYVVLRDSHDTEEGEH